MNKEQNRIAQYTTMSIDGEKHLPVENSQVVICIKDNPYAKSGDLHKVAEETNAFYGLMLGNEFFAIYNGKVSVPLSEVLLEFPKNQISTVSVKSSVVPYEERECNCFECHYGLAIEHKNFWRFDDGYGEITDVQKSVLMEGLDFLAAQEAFLEDQPFEAVTTLCFEGEVYLSLEELQQMFSTSKQ